MDRSSANLSIQNNGFGYSPSTEHSLPAIIYYYVCEKELVYKLMVSQRPQQTSNRMSDEMMQGDKTTEVTLSCQPASNAAVLW